MDLGQLWKMVSVEGAGCPFWRMGFCRGTAGDWKALQWPGGTMGAIGSAASLEARWGAERHCGKLECDVGTEGF